MILKRLSQNLGSIFAWIHKRESKLGSGNRNKEVEL